MVAASPASAKEKDYYGSIPLHVALKNNETPEAVVLALIAAWSASAKEKGGYGKSDGKNGGGKGGKHGKDSGQKL